VRLWRRMQPACAWPPRGQRGCSSRQRAGAARRGGVRAGKSVAAAPGSARAAADRTMPAVLQSEPENVRFGAGSSENRRQGGRWIGIIW